MPSRRSPEAAGTTHRRERAGRQPSAGDDAPALRLETVANPHQQQPAGNQDHRDAALGGDPEDDQQQPEEGDAEVVGVWEPERREARRDAFPELGGAELQVRQADHRPVDHQR